MLEAQICQYAQRKGFHPRTLERWLDWDQPDRDALFRLAISLKIGENHLRDLMDWLEEIRLRDQSKIREILASKPITDVESDSRLGRADKLKRIKEEIRRLRFPRLAQTEDSRDLSHAQLFDVLEDQCLAIFRADRAERRAHRVVRSRKVRCG